MPYIESKYRVPAAELPQPHTAGELSYLITVLCQKYLVSRATVSYDSLSQVVGVLESTKAEFIRRAVDPFEEGKAASNGDLW